MTEAEKDAAEQKLLDYARKVVVHAGLLDTCKKRLNKVSRDSARNARKDLTEAIERLQAFHRLLTSRLDND